MVDNEDVGEEAQNASAENVSNNAIAEIEFLKNQNAEISQKLNSLLEAKHQPAEPVKPMSPTEFSELFTKDPQAAITYAFDAKFNAKSSQIENHLNSKQQQQFYDQKAEKDFPLISTDKQFQNLVREETKALIEDGMSKDSPKLVYRAARDAAVKYEALKGIKATEGSGGLSGEAPTNIQKGKGSDKALPKNFEKMSAMFGLSDSAKERAKENFAYRAKLEEGRKGGR